MGPDLHFRALGLRRPELPGGRNFWSGTVTANCDCGNLQRACRLQLSETGHFPPTFAEIALHKDYRATQCFCFAPRFRAVTLSRLKRQR